MTNRPDEAQPQPTSDDDTIGHLAEDAGMPDEEFTNEAGLSTEERDPAGTAAVAFPPD